MRSTSSSEIILGAASFDRCKHVRPCHQVLGKFVALSNRSSRWATLFNHDNFADHSLGLMYYTGVFIFAGNIESVFKVFPGPKKPRVERLSSRGIGHFLRLDS